MLLERVVATPGTTVEVREGHITIDGTPAPVVDGFEQLGTAHHRVSFANGGGPDNRGNSRDGRFFGLVTREAILDHAIAVYWRSGPTWDGP
ncbi:MAG TPA: hypothetical protein VGO00_00860 [Kofleriaceae bacterium]|nr:hypothetical protein [Kofleriaceae bacterium]